MKIASLSLIIDIDMPYNLKTLFMKTFAIFVAVNGCAIDTK